MLLRKIEALKCKLPLPGSSCQLALQYTWHKYKTLIKWRKETYNAVFHYFSALTARLEQLIIVEQSHDSTAMDATMHSRKHSMMW